MAAGRDIKGITIEIGADTKGVVSAMAGINKEAKNTQAQLKDIDRLLKLDPTNTELLKQKQQLLTQSIGETKDKLVVLKDAEKQAQQQFAEGKISKDQYDALKREIVATENQLKNLEGQAKSANSSLQSMADATGKFGDSATNAGKKMMPVTAGIVALGTASVAAFNTVDAGYDTIVKKTGATGKELDGLTKSMDNLFGNMPIRAQDAGVAIGEVNTRFGVTGKTLENLSGEFVKFANINEADLNTSIGNTSKIMQQWNVDISQTDNLLGMISKKSQETGISTDSLMQSIQQNGATLKEMGLDLGQSITLLSEFEKNGVNADVAMAGLKKAVVNYTKQGMSMDDALSTTISSIKNASSETEALSIAQGIFGAKGANEMTKAIREGRLSVDDISGAMEEYGSVVSDTFEATQDAPDRMKVALNNLALAGKDLGAVLLTTLAPMIESLAGTFKNMAQWFSGLSEGQKKTIISILALVAAIGPLLIFIGKMSTGISAIMTLAIKLGPILSKLGPIIGIVKTAFSGLFAIIAANPVILIIAAIIAVLILLWTKCDWFREGVITIFNALVAGIKFAINAIATFLKSAWESMQQEVMFIVGIIKSYILIQFEALKLGISLIWDAIKLVFTLTWITIQAIVQTAIDVIKTIIDTTFKVIGIIIKTTMDVIKQIIGVVMAIISGDWKGAWEGIKGIVATIGNGITSAIGTIGEGIKKVFTGIINNAKKWGEDMIQGIIDGIKGMINKVGDAAKSVATKISSFLHFSRPDEGPLHYYEEWMPDFMNGLASGVKANAGKVIGEINKLATQMDISTNMNSLATVGSQTLTFNNTSIVNLGNKELVKDITPPIVKEITRTQTNKMAGGGRRV